MPGYYGLIEGGGTKFNCAIANESGALVKRSVIPTTTPDDTFANVIAFFNAHSKPQAPIVSMGIGCFGPLVLSPESPSYGHITNTPKPGWQDTDVLSYLRKHFDCPITLDTDVNGAALAEYRWGAAKETSTSVYVTVGTGIGGGVVVNGNLLHGLVHPEIGHMLIAPQEGVKGVCPFHQHCAEGYASGTAIKSIFSTPTEQLEPGSAAWTHLSNCLASLCHNLLLTLSPERIVLGGGVINVPGLLSDIVGQTESSLNGYLLVPGNRALEEIIVNSRLGNDTGIYGALALTDQGKVSALPV